jgi:hypothetical protein
MGAGRGGEVERSWESGMEEEIRGSLILSPVDYCASWTIAFCLS